jgi:pyruvate/2-oxoglutarate dehydrogenase complex dihydrolipoamide acyltransferase (E2) component
MALLQEIKVPLLAVNDTSLTVVEIGFANGQKVRKGDNLMVFETSKTTYDVAAETEGYVQYLCRIDEDYEVNETVAKIFSEAGEAEELPIANKEHKKEENTAGFSTPVAATIWKGEPLFSIDALRLIESSGCSKAIFAGRAFVSRGDVEEALGLKTKPETIVSGTGRGTGTKSFSPQKSRSVLPVDETKVIVEKLSSNKKREIEYLSEVQSTGLTSTINILLETEGIFTHINPSLKYLKDSLLPVIIYECGRLLRKYPMLNAYYTGESVALYREVNIGFAIDIEKGLKVLKLAGTDKKGIGEIEEEIMRLSNNYIDDRLRFEDLTDITFAITDLSSEGVAFFRPLINMMNSAILGVSAIDQKLNRCTLSLSFDHRVTEGKTVALFLGELKARMASYQTKYHPLPNQDISCYKCYKKLNEDLGEIGFVKCITPAGEEAYICQACFKGF